MAMLKTTFSPSRLAARAEEYKGRAARVTHSRTCCVYECSADDARRTFCVSSVVRGTSSAHSRPCSVLRGHQRTTRAKLEDRSSAVRAATLPPHSAEDPVRTASAPPRTVGHFDAARLCDTFGVPSSPQTHVRSALGLPADGLHSWSRGSAYYLLGGLISRSPPRACTTDTLAASYSSALKYGHRGAAQLPARACQGALLHVSRRADAHSPFGRHVGAAFGRDVPRAWAARTSNLRHIAAPHPRRALLRAEYVASARAASLTVAYVASPGASSQLMSVGGDFGRRRGHISLLEAWSVWSSRVLCALSESAGTVLGGVAGASLLGNACLFRMPLPTVANYHKAPQSQRESYHVFVRFGSPGIPFLSAPSPPAEFRPFVFSIAPSRSRLLPVVFF
ncbi:hypothetical protein FB451DRAFT_1494173 [Mycena latifolia]|nr:hypothetical protein FB451DRAFT_1494173 [Mycena latifolia]